MFFTFGSQFVGAAGRAVALFFGPWSGGEGSVTVIHLALRATGQAAQRYRFQARTPANG